MNLTAYRGKQKKSPQPRRAHTTDPGYTNRKGQVVIESTGAPSTTFPGQLIYRLKCQACAHEYGSNGTDIHVRNCPKCQGGKPGEPLREKAAGLFGP